MMTTEDKLVIACKTTIIAEKVKFVCMVVAIIGYFAKKPKMSNQCFINKFSLAKNGSLGYTTFIYF